MRKNIDPLDPFYKSPKKLIIVFLHKKNSYYHSNDANMKPIRW